MMPNVQGPQAALTNLRVRQHKIVFTEGRAAMSEPAVFGMPGLGLEPSLGSDVGEARPQR